VPEVLSQHLLNHIFEGLPVGVVAAEIETKKLVYANANFLTMVNYRLEEIQAMTPMDLHPLDELPRVIETFQQMVDGSLDRVSAIKVRRKDGSVFIADIHFTASDPSQSGLVVATFQDITDRYLAAKALEEQEARLRLAFSVAKQAWFDLDLPSGTIQVSDEHALMLGYNPKSFSKSLRSWHQLIHPADRKPIFSAFRRYIQGKTNEFRVEYRQRASNGNWKWTQALGKVIEWLPDNKAKRLIGLNTDINKHKTLEKQLETESTFLKSVLANIPDLIWLKDPEGVYIGCNKRFESLYGSEENLIIGNRDIDFVDEELSELFRHYDQLALKADKPVRNEEWLTFKSDGHQELVETTKVPLKTDKGQVIGVLGIAHDITDRHQSENKLKLAASVFRTAMEGIMITDAEGTIVEINESFSRITGYLREDAIGQNARLLGSGKQSEHFYETMWRNLVQQGSWSGEIWNRRSSGEVYAEFLNISAVKDSKGNVSHYIGVFSDISTLKEQEKQLEFVAQYDVLTGLPNRALLLTQLRQELLKMKHSHKACAVVVIDLDSFREINDTKGNHIGDLVLIEAAARFKTILRDHDILSRIGGDEFIVVLTELTDPHLCVAVLERLLYAAADLFSIEGHPITLTASIGVTFAEQHSDLSAEKLIRQADQAMYHAKIAGKNRFYVFNPEDDQDARLRFDTINEIRSGLVKDEFVLYYQPKVAIRSGNIIGFEALIRWQHPTKGLLSPASFVPIISMHPLAIELGNWVLEEALKQLTIWNTQGFNTKVSINIDSMQLNDPEFSQRVLSHLGDFTNVDPAQLELEILETNALEEIQNVSQLIEDLQSNDIQFALDDFGTGYSSMTFLKNLPATTIKIDQSFVRQMLFDSEQMIIVDSVINLSKRFGRTVLAEGVETELHGLFLSALGCEQAQGYGIAKPMPANEVLRWTQEWQCPTLWTQVRRLSPSEVDSLLLVVEHIGQCRALRIEHNHHTLRTTPFEKMDFINWFCSLASATDPRLHQINQQIPAEIESLRLALNHGQSCDDLAHQSNQIVANMLKVIFRDVDFELPSNCKMFEFD